MDTLKLRDRVSLGEVTSSPAQASFDSWQCRGSCQGSRTDRQMCQNRQPEWQSLLGAVEICDGNGQAPVSVYASTCTGTQHNHRLFQGG